MSNDTGSNIGEGRDRVDGRPKVTGTARFSAENNLPGLVHAVVVSATIPNGTIKTIDTAAARKAAGVITVISHLNAPKLAYLSNQGSGKNETGGNQPSPAGGAAQGGLTGGSYAEPRAVPFVDNQVHYVGQQIAVVVADTLEHATHGAELVKVTYTTAPARTDMAALRGDAKDKPPGPQSSPFMKGDPLAAFASAPVKIDQTYRTPFHHHNPIEAHAVVAHWEASDRLTVYDATQNMFGSRNTLAKAFGIPRENIRILTPYIGGAFGSKGGMWPHVLVGVIAAREVQRPVKLWVPRKQLFFTNGHRPETEQRVALGATPDGKLVSLIHEGVSQSNAVCDYNERFTKPTRVMYAAPNIRAASPVVELDLPSPTYMRAPGENPGMFAIESALDELAYQLKIDPVQLRLINHADVDPAEGKPWSSKSLKECYARAAERFGWSKRNPQPGATREGRLLIGQGMASATYPTYRAPASARARANADGTIVISSGSHEMGTGTATVMAQLAAETLGVPVERVRFEYGDTTLPTAPISAGSLTAASVGSAVFGAASALRQKLGELAGKDSNSPLGGGAADESIAKLLTRNYLPSVEVQFDAKPSDDEHKWASHAFGAHFAEVSVDADLGLVRVRRMVSAFAGGRILNAKTAHSQLLGGIVQGIGMALMEETHLDRRFGSFVNVNFGEYLLPTNADIHDLDIILVEEHDPHVNPIGVKGLGEVGIVGVAPAIANAVYHATGKRVRDLPITMEKVM